MPTTVVLGPTARVGTPFADAVPGGQIITSINVCTTQLDNGTEIIAAVRVYYQDSYFEYGNFEGQGLHYNIVLDNNVLLTGITGTYSGSVINSIAFQTNAAPGSGTNYANRTIGNAVAAGATPFSFQVPWGGRAVGLAGAVGGLASAPAIVAIGLYVTIPTLVLNPGSKRAYDSGRNPSIAITNASTFYEVHESSSVIPIIGQPLWFTMGPSAQKSNSPASPLTATSGCVSPHICCGSSFSQNGGNAVVTFEGVMQIDEGPPLPESVDEPLSYQILSFIAPVKGGGNQILSSAQGIGGGVFLDPPTFSPVSGSIPVGAVNNAGYFVLAYTKSTNVTSRAIYYRTGRIVSNPGTLANDNTATTSITVGLERSLAEGEQSAQVALNDNNQVVIVSADNSLTDNSLYCRVGTLTVGTQGIVDQTIAFGPRQTYGTGTNPHVCLNNNGVVVEVHEAPVGSALWTNLGFLNAIPSTVWFPNEAWNYDSGEDPGIAIDDSGTVAEVHEQSGIGFDLWLQTGVVMANL